jgi:cellulose synthase/poly-beta-1,6-N-acetylglucosamine synthase-like glycosyltransferase
MTEQVLSSNRVTRHPQAFGQRPVDASISTAVTRRDDLQAAFVEAFVDEPNRRANLVVTVIPAYDEDRFIGSVVLKTRWFVDQVIVVDDGSSDQTATIASEAGAEVIMHTVSPAGHALTSW